MLKQLLNKILSTSGFYIFFKSKNPIKKSLLINLPVHLVEFYEDITEDGQVFYVYIFQKKLNFS